MRARLAIALIAFGCGPEYPSGRVLDRPRVLAVRLDPPEARIGDAVRADALVGAPLGVEPPAALLWQCPPDEYFPHGCVDAEGAIPIEGEIAIGEDWTERVSRADPYHVYLIVTATLASGTDEDTAIKRLVLGQSEEEPPNQNPSLEEVRIEGEGETVTLTPVPAEGSIEPYLLRTLDGQTVETEEELFVSWYATCGSLGSGLTSGENLATTFRRESEPCTVWAILRDARGGTDWLALSP